MKLKVADTSRHVTFETAFANLAYAALKDRAPELLPYSTGFQLVERTEDNTKALGVLGFKLQNQSVTLPVVFINGELKGFDILILNNKDMFVPLDTQWIDDLVTAKEQKLGAPSRKGETRFANPDLSPYYRIPSEYKYGWSKQAVDNIRKAFNIKKAYKFLLPELVSKYPKIAADFATLIRQKPSLRKTISTFYGRDIFKKASKCLKNYIPLAEYHPRSILPDDIKKYGRLRIYTITDSEEELKDLTPEERQELLSLGIIVKDKRKNFSTIYSHAQIVTHFSALNKKLGVYLVFDLRNKPVKVVVLDKGLLAFEGEDPKQFYSSPLNAGYAPVNGPHSIVSFSDGLSSDPTVRDAPRLGIYLPKITIKDVLAKGMTLDQVPKTGKLPYNIHYIGVTPKGKTITIYVYEDNRNIYVDNDSYFDIKIDKNVNDPIGVGGVCYIPPTTRFFKVKEGDISLRDLSGAINIIFNQAEKISLHNTGTEVILNSQRMSPNAAFISLMRDYGLSKESSRRALTDACKTTQIFYIKRAQLSPEDVLPTPISTPNDYSRVDVMKDSFPVGDMAQPLESSNIIQEAEKLKNKEILDTAIVSRLIEANSDEHIVDKYLPDLITGMDKLGKLLFNSYWHVNKFKSRFGEDYDTIVEALRTAFYDIGKVVLKLKQKMPYFNSALASEIELETAVE